MTRATIATMLACLSATGCGHDDGPADGTLDIRIYGGDHVETGIPSDAFADGWDVQWDTFIVALDRVATTTDADDARYLFDLTAISGGAGNRVAELGSPSGMATLAYRISHGDAATDGNVPAETVAMFEESEWSVYVEGRAVKDAAHLTFAWGFTTRTEYAECEVAEVVPEAGEVRTQISIDALQMFHDAIGSDDASPRFDAIAAADTDMDGIVAPGELVAVDIASLEGYDPGDAEVANLFEFIKAQVASFGHIDGDGPCVVG